MDAPPDADARRALVKAAEGQGIEALLDSVPGAWFFTRHDGTFAYVSRAACEWLGYSRAELLALTVFDVDIKISREQWDIMWRSTSPPDSLVIRTVHRRKDGSAASVELRAARVFMNGEDIAVSYSVDLTRSEETEAALAATQAELMRLLDHLPDLVFRIRCGPAAQFSFVSPSSSALLGYTPSQLVGAAEHVQRVVHPDDLQSLLAPENRDPGLGRRVRFLHRDGHAVWMEVRATTLISESGAHTIEGVARDITETHEREQLRERLHRAQRLEAVGQLAGAIAHDFNNLLQVIQGHTSLVRSMQAEPHADALLGGVLSAAQRASTLIKQLLAFSRKGTLDFVEIDLGQALSPLRELLARLMGENVQLSWDCAAGPLCVFGNAAQLEQLVANLCINARDALPRGGHVRVSLDNLPAAELPRSFGAITDASEYVRLVVSDDGEGMSEEVQRRLFEPFFTTKGPGKGTGLGLSSVYATVQAHRGHIDVSSTLGEGSTFRIFLPRVPARARATPLEPRARQADGRGHLALVAEDEPEVLRLTATYLMQAGFDVLTTRDGAEAEQLLIEGGSTVHVAVLDMVMPSRGGLAIYNGLRDRNILTPVVFITGYDDELLDATARQPTVAVLRKPFGRDELLGCIAALIDGAPKRRLSERRALPDSGEPTPGGASPPE